MLASSIAHHVIAFMIPSHINCKSCTALGMLLIKVIAPQNPRTWQGCQHKVRRLLMAGIWTWVKTLRSIWLLSIVLRDWRSLNIIIIVIYNNIYIYNIYIQKYKWPQKTRKLAGVTCPSAKLSWRRDSLLGWCFLCAHAAVGVQDTWCHQKWRDGRTPQNKGFTHGKADSKILLV